jgi:hypothetical protein
MLSRVYFWGSKFSISSLFSLWQKDVGIHILVQINSAMSSESEWHQY